MRQTTDGQHARLLLALLQQRWSEVDERLAAAPPDAEAFVAMCLECDVAPQVLDLLEANALGERVGTDVVARLERFRSRIRRDNLLLLARAEQALDVLLAAGVVPVVLKGLDLMYRLGRSFDARTMDDVDLLIAERDLPAALRALRAAGWVLPSREEAIHWVRTSHHLPMHSPGPIPVEFEIHWSLAQEMRFRVDDGGLHERARTLDVDGRKVRRLDDHDFVAHLLLHHFTHYFDRRLKWAIDLHAVAHQDGFSWEIVAERVRQWQATAVCGMALLQLAKQFPDWIPDEILGKLPVSPWRRLATRPLISKHPLDLFRNTQDRRIRRFLAAVLLERPAQLPGWLLHRQMRERWRTDHPLDNSLLDSEGPDAANGSSGPTSDS